MFKLKLINKPKMMKLKCNFTFPNVVLANLQEKEATPTKEIQQIIADQQYDGLSKVVVNAIPDEYIIPNGDINIIENGTYDVNNYSSAEVNVPEKVLGTKTITTNGTYNATDDNLDGYSQVEVTTSGVDINEYFETTYSGTSPNNWLLDNFVKKVPDIVIDDSVTSLSGFARDFKYTPKIICNSNVKNMSNMYYSTSSQSIDVSGLNTSNVNDMSWMFYSSKIANIDLSNFDTSNVNTFARLFSNCGSLTSLDLSSFVTNKATNMSYMLSGCRKLTSLDLSNWNVSNVNEMVEMFSGCSSLTSLDLSNFVTSNATNMSGLFKDCNNLTSLDLSNFETNKLTNVQKMFYACRGLTSLDLSNFTLNTSVPTYQSDMFYGCSNLTSLNLSNFNVGKNSYTQNMFRACSSLTNLDIRNFDFAKVTSYNNMFNGVPTDCLIIVKDDTAKTWITSKFTNLTNVKTVAELEQ